MNAIIDVVNPQEPLFPFGWRKLICLAPKTKSLLSVNGQDVMLYRLHPWYAVCFPRFVKKLQAIHPKLFFTEEMRRYPSVYQEEALAPYLFRDLKGILSCFCSNRMLRVAVVCDNESPCPDSVIEALSEYCSSVTVCTDEEPVFEQIIHTALYDYGLSVRCKPLGELGREDLILNFSEKSRDFSGKTKFLIDFTKNSFASGNTILADYCPDTTQTSDQELYKLKIKHCYFIREDQKISKILWKNEKKS